MKNKSVVAVQILDELEAELQRLQLWKEEALELAVLEKAAQSPFGCGEIAFHEWVQFIFIPRLRQMIENGTELPKNMLIHTYAQEFYRGDWATYRHLIGLFKKMDTLFSEEN